MVAIVRASSSIATDGTMPSKAALAERWAVAGMVGRHVSASHLVTYGVAGGAQLNLAQPNYHHHGATCAYHREPGRYQPPPGERVYHYPVRHCSPLPAPQLRFPSGSMIATPVKTPIDAPT